MHRKKFLLILDDIIFPFERPLTLISVFNIVYFTLKYFRGLNWQDHELSELQGSAILPQLVAYSKKVNRKFNGVQKHVLSSYPKIFVPSVYTR